MTLAPTAYRLALQLSASPSTTSLQPHQQRQLHWWCRRYPSRRYASWGRHNPIDGTEQRPVTRHNDQKSVDEYELSPREKIWKAKMEMINRMMRSDAYEGLFGPSNRMLRGLDWRESGWQKMWNEQWKDMEKMSGAMREEARTMLKAFQRDLKYPDSEVAKQAAENGRVKEELARAGWQYDPVSNKMVPKTEEMQAGESMPGRKEERRDGFVEIPVKPYTEKSSGTGESMPGRSEEVRTGFSDIPVKTFRPQVEFSAKDAERAPANSSRRIPVPIESQLEVSVDHTSPKRATLPKDDIDLLSAEDVRARMGHVTLPVRETTAQKDTMRAELETKFEESQRQSRIIEAELMKVRAEHTEVTSARNRAADAEAANEQWRLQREQLKEAAADFQARERKARKHVRELQQLHQSINSRLLGLQGRSNGLVRSGSLSPTHAVQLDAVSAALQADSKILSKASALLAAAVQVASRAVHHQAPSYVEPSLDRYAWDKKPFAKIRDAEELITNIRDSLRNAEEVIKTAETKLEKGIKLAGSLNAEVDRQRLAMRGHEEQWRWRQDDAAVQKPAMTPRAQETDAELENELRTIYENEYGAITARHSQIPAAQDVTEEEAYAAMSLGGIPEIAPASFDGGIVAEQPRMSKSSLHPEEFSGTPSTALESSASAAGEATYTILALDPAMGLITKATTSSTAKAESEEPIPLAEALQRVAQPAMFINYLPELRQQGFEPISSSENLMVLKKLGGRTSDSSAAVLQRAPEVDTDVNTVPAAEPSLSMETTSPATSGALHSDAASEEVPSEISGDGMSYYSTRLQSPTSSTFQGLKPKKVEPVFSGEQGGHANYERLRRHFRHNVRERKMRRRRARRGIRKFVGTVLTLAGACYLAGVVSEWLRGYLSQLEGSDAARQLEGATKSSR